MKHESEEHRHAGHEGLSRDLEVLAVYAERRKILQWIGLASLAPVLGCASNAVSGLTGTDAGAAKGDAGGATGEGGAASGTCAEIPDETGGPYPGDGTNGSNVLVESGVVRSDIRSSFGAFSGTAEGVLLTVKFTVVNTKANCAALAGYAVYIWHCDRDGKYSLYTATDQNYLRGVQETDDKGTVMFTSIFPACYPGRWPHIHFEIFSSLASATSGAGKVKTSQLALPVEACNEAFATAGYSESVSTLKQVSLSSDNVFRDGSLLQLPTITGNATDGFVVTLTVGVAV